MAETIDTTKRGVLKGAALAMPVVALAGGAAAATWAHPMDTLTPSQKSFAMAAMRTVTDLAREQPLALAALGQTPDVDALIAAGFACGAIEAGDVPKIMAGLGTGRRVRMFVDDGSPLFADDVTRTDQIANLMETSQ